MQNKEWFETWFASPFYDVLYAHRDEKEAELFVETVLRELPLSAEAHILDLACGKGRHSFAFARKGAKVIGIDLTERFIREARQKAEKEKLPVQFLVGDIRNFSFPEKFDLIFNGFTSFGYFENSEENLQVLQRVRKHLKSGGFFILDYLNSEKVSKEVQGGTKEEKDFSEHRIFITKEILNGFVYKNIKIIEKESGNLVEVFRERVRLFSREELRNLLQNAGLEVVKLWGNYKGEEFEKNSPRMIFVCQKTRKSL